MRMIPVEALGLALKKEIEAAQMYEEMAIRFPEIKDTLMFLKIEEEKHRELIEKKIVEFKK